VERARLMRNRTHAQNTGSLKPLLAEGDGNEQPLSRSRLRLHRSGPASPHALPRLPRYSALRKCIHASHAITAIIPHHPTARVALPMSRSCIKTPH